MSRGIGGSTAEAELAAIERQRDAVPPIAPEEYMARIARAQARMEELGVEAMWLDGTTNLAYFTGVKHGQSERMVGAILPRRGEVAYLAPGFEVERLKSMLILPGPVRGWEEDESPYALFVDILESMQVQSGGIALDDLARWFVADGIREAGGDSFRYLRSAAIASHLRSRKSAAEVALLRQAMGMTLRIQAAAARILRPGITTTEIGAFLDAAHRKAGFDSGCVFSIVLFGEASAYPHGVPYPQELREGDTVLMDCGAPLHGYVSDITRSLVFGEASARQRFVWETVRAAQLASFAAAQAGRPAGGLDGAARGVIEAAGFGPGYATPGLPHRLGHGIGMDVHEEPYFVRGNALKLAPGMCGSIEPTIAIYGEFGMRLEDHVVIGEGGPSWLTPPAESLDDVFAAG
jgi:Xaa-Pro dipeptidase